MSKPLKVIIESTLEELSDRIEALTEEYQINQGKDIGTFYILPEQEVIERAARRPQILMLFKQPAKELTENFPRAVDSRVSFRLMEKTKQNITKQDLEFYAGRIKTLFGGDTPFIWERGKGLYTYLDQIKGYRLQVLAVSEQAAKKVMEQVLDVQSHSPDWTECFGIHTSPTPEEKYDDTPGRETILGESYKEPRRRPRVTMEFFKAEIHIPGIMGNTLLCDRTGYLYKASSQQP
jgi:hypothetical protein